MIMIVMMMMMMMMIAHHDSDDPEETKRTQSSTFDRFLGLPLKSEQVLNVRVVVQQIELTPREG